MFGKKKEINVRIKLYSGLDKGLDLGGGDPGKGIEMILLDGTILKKALQSIGMKEFSSNAYFCNGKRIGLWKKLRQGNEVVCIRPSGGG